ncbi:flagellar biosynthetic protein FliO [Thalassotalea piscium]
MNVLKNLSKFFRYLPIYLTLCWVSASAVAQEETVQVGKHANTNLDASSMILSLLMVLALIVISAMVLKKFQLTGKSVSGMKVITSLSLGPKERLVVVEVQNQQLLLGVSGQQITLLKTLEEPIVVESGAVNNMNSSLLKFMTKSSTKHD